MIRLVKVRLPLYYTIIICIAIAALTYFFFTRNSEPDVRESSAENSASQLNPNNDVSIKRLSGYDYISPLMFVETHNKSAKFASLTQKITEYIEAKKQSKEIAGASFYLKDAQTLDWTGYNENEKFSPGSLMKVPELISVLRLEEEKPGTLNKQIFFEKSFVTEKQTKFISKQLEPGKNYSVKELLRYMIAHSDNNATVLLDQHLDQRIFNKTLSDIGLPMPERNAINYPVSAKDFTLFMRAIYNAAYLTIPHSEYAAELLSTSDFKEGFSKGFPTGVKMIHKFGEAGNMEERQLHESCIVYVSNKPYFLTVMTKGNDMLKLSAALSEIAAMAYQQVSAMP